MTACLVGCATEPGPIKRQMVGLLEKFDRWDYNGDGHLEGSELKEAGKVSQFPEEEIIEFYDTDKDGKISRDEASGGLNRVDEAREVAEDLEAAEDAELAQ